MTAEPRPRPWWSSDGDRHDDDRDPLEAHRAARQGKGTSDRGEADEAGHVPGPCGPAGPAGAGGLGRSPVAGVVADVLREAAEALAPAAPGRGGSGSPARDRSARDRPAPDRPAPVRSGPTEPPTVDPSDDAHRFETCGICPLCALIRAVGAARPDVVVHLADAAHHLSAALQAVVGAPARGRSPTGSPGGPDPADGFGRIDLDADDEEPAT